MLNKLAIKGNLIIVSLMILLSTPVMASAATNVADSNTSNAVELQRSHLLDKETSYLLKHNKPLSLTAKSAIAIDYKTGQVLYEKNAYQSLPTASMSKILTLYVTLKHIKDGKIHWNDKVTINKALHDLSVNHNYANVKLTQGKQYTIRQLYQAALYSENAATMALGYGVAHGSTQRFALMMRSEAKKIGITDAKVYTACGLTNGEVGSLGFSDASYDAENELSARDMSLLTMHILRLYPQILKTSSANTTQFENTTMLNWNWMIKGRSQALPDIKVDGLKTGTSDTAKACFTGTAVKNGHRIITVVMGVPNAGQYDPARFIQTRKLMKYVYAKYHYVALNKSESLSVATNRQHNSVIDVPNGKQKSVEVGIAANQGVWLTKNQSLEVTKVSAISKYAKGNGVDAGSFKTGDTIAKAKFAGIRYIKGVPTTVNLIAKDQVDKANIFVRFWRSMTSWF